MTNFFSAIQGKFKAGYHGRYLGHILEQVAVFHPEITKPILKNAPLQCRKLPRQLLQTVTTETSYLSNEIFRSVKINSKRDTGACDQFDSSEVKDRQSDLEITLSTDHYWARVIVEIKMFDEFHENQLEDYIDWARRRHELEDRAVVVLTAYPIDSISQKIIENNSDVISHMYLSDLTIFDTVSQPKSELAALFQNYLTEEGYAMYQLKSNEDDSDYKALHSYMVLSFLPHASGHGRVATSKNIARGPVVFSNIIQNWQLVSDRLASQLNFPRIPTIRYYPEQSSKDSTINIDLPKDRILELRRHARKNKHWGRYWLCSDSVCSDDKVRLEWGQILQIQSGGENNADGIECTVYALIKRGTEQLSEAIPVVLKKDGVKDARLYSPEIFMKLLRQCVDEAAISAIKRSPDIQDKLPWLAEKVVPLS